MTTTTPTATATAQRPEQRRDTGRDQNRDEDRNGAPIPGSRPQHSRPETANPGTNPTDPGTTIADPGKVAGIPGRVPGQGVAPAGLSRDGQAGGAGSVAGPAEGLHALDGEEKRLRARADWRASGGGLSGAALARRYGMRSRWGQKQVAAARAEDEDAARGRADNAPPVPAVPPPAHADAPGTVRTPSRAPMRTPAPEANSTVRTRPAPVRSPQDGAGTPQPGRAPERATRTAPQHRHAHEDGAHTLAGTHAREGQGARDAYRAAMWERFGAWWNRAALSLGRFLVLAVAAAMSYGHMRHVAETTGEDVWVAAIWPLSIDGLLLVCLVTIKQARHHGEPAGAAAWLAFVLALAGSVAANVASAGPVGLSWLVAGSPPVALLLAEVVGNRRTPAPAPERTGTPVREAHR